MTLVYCFYCSLGFSESKMAKAWYNPRLINCAICYQCKKCYDDEEKYFEVEK